MTKPNVFGGTGRNKGATEAVFFTLADAEENKAKNMGMGTVLLDMEKCYEKLAHSQIWQSMLNQQMDATTAIITIKQYAAPRATLVGRTCSNWNAPTCGVFVCLLE